MSLIKFLAIAPISFSVILGESLLSNSIPNSVLAQTSSDRSLIQDESATFTNPNSKTIIAQTSGNERRDRPRNGETIRRGIDLLRQIIPNQPRVDERQVFEEEFKQADINQAVHLFEAYQGKKFVQHLDLDNIVIPPTIAEISQTLSNLYQSTGKKPALSYVVSLKDELHLILILPNSNSVSSTSNQITSLLPRLTKNTQKYLGFKESISITQNSTNNAERIVLKVTRKDLEKLANQFRGEVLDRTQSTVNLTSAQTLYQALIAPLEANLKANNIDTLIISADSGFRSLPIAALHDGKQYLIEKYGFAIIPTFRLSNLSSTSNIKNAKILAMGVSKATDGQQPLPAAQVEVDILSHQWQGEKFLDEEATVDNLKYINHLQRFGIIHLATHADFNKGRANNSYIQFWDRKLKLKQLQSLAKELQWNKVDMLVLSACRTALGNEEAELGFAGLAVQAGAKTAIGSLWKVSDEGTLGLMTEFYSRLKTAPNKAEALRQAQIAMLKGEIRSEGGQLILASQTPIALPAEIFTESEKFTHPYYWSAFTVIGNWN